MRTRVVFEITDGCDGGMPWVPHDMSHVRIVSGSGDQQIVTEQIIPSEALVDTPVIDYLVEDLKRYAREHRTKAKRRATYY